MKAATIKDGLSNVTHADASNVRTIPVACHNSAAAMLTADVRSILDSLIQFLNRDAVEHLIPILEIEVRGIVDPEDGGTQLIVRIWTTGLSEDEDYAYFRDVCGRLEVWRNTLDEAANALFNAEFILQSRCAENA
jgi:hypothetical protein